MASPRRSLRVTLCLVGLGAVAGAACGAMIPVGIVLVTSRYGNVILPGMGFLAAVGAGFGALVGSVVGPAVGWGLLRRAPLGKAVLWSAAGTVAGAVVGDLLAPLNPYTWGMPGVVAGGILGCFVASAALRLHTLRAARRVSVPEPPNANNEVWRKGKICRTAVACRWPHPMVYCASAVASRVSIASAVRGWRPHTTPSSGLTPRLRSTRRHGGWPPIHPCDALRRQLDCPGSPAAATPRASASARVRGTCH